MDEANREASMTEEINDYAPALLKIKAAIKELEALLPEKRWIEAAGCARTIKSSAWDLDQICVLQFAGKVEKAA